MINNCLNNPHGASGGLFFKKALSLLIKTNEDFQEFKDNPYMFLETNLPKSIYTQLPYVQVSSELFKKRFTDLLLTTGKIDLNGAETLLKSILEAINIKGQKEISKSHASIEELNQVLKLSDTEDDSISYNSFETIQEWLGLRFAGSYEFGQKFVRDFINNDIIKSAIINTDPGHEELLVDTGDVDSPINRGYQVKLLKKTISLFDKLLDKNPTLFSTLPDNINKARQAAESLHTLNNDTYNSYYEQNAELINYIENNWDSFTEALFTKLAVHTVHKSTGNEVHPISADILATYLSLFEKNPNDELVKEGLANYQDAIFVADFDKILESLSKGVLQVVPDSKKFSPNEIRYIKSTVANEYASLYNRNETVDKTDTTPQVVSLILENLEVYPYAKAGTKNETPLSTFSPSMSVVYSAMTKLQYDRQDGVAGMRRAIQKALSDNSGVYEEAEKNILYTLNKKLFSENEGSIAYTIGLKNKSNEHLLNVLLNDFNSTVQVRLAEASWDHDTKTFRMISSERRNQMEVNSMIRMDVDNYLSAKPIQFFEGIENKYKTNNGTYSVKLGDEFHGEEFTFYKDSKSAGQSVVLSEQDIPKLTSIIKQLTGIDLNRQYATGSSMLDYLKNSDGSRDSYGNFTYTKTLSTLALLAKHGLDLANTFYLAKNKDIIGKLKDPNINPETDLNDYDKELLKSAGLDLSKIKRLKTEDIQNLNNSIAEILKKELPNKIRILTDFHGNRSYRSIPKDQSITVIASSLTAAKQAVTGEEAKTTTLNLEGNQEARFSNSNTAGNIKSIIGVIKKRLKSIKKQTHRSVFSANPFIQTDGLFKGMLKRSSIAKDDVVRPNSKSSVLETFRFNADLGYFNRILEFQEDKSTNTNFSIIFDPTNYSDKTSNFLMEVGQNPNSNSSYNMKIVFSPATAQGGLKLTDAKAVKNLHRKSVFEYKNAFAENIVNDYMRIYSYIISNNLMPNALNYIQNQLMTLNSDAPNSMKLAAINDINKELFHGEEYSISGKSYDGSEVMVELAKLAGVQLIDYVHYNDLSASTFLKKGSNKPTTSKILPFVKDSIIFELSIYEDQSRYDKYMQRMEDNFAKSLLEMGYTFGPAAEALAKKHFPNNHNIAVMQTRDADGNEVIKLHPLMQKYFYDSAYFVDNFMKLAVGDDNNQKDKKVKFTTGDFNKDLDTLFAVQNNQWIAQTKRNVSMTASMTMYTGGTYTGISHGINTAVMQDIESSLDIILGTRQKVTDLDGASFIGMDHLYHIYNSLGTDYAPTLGIDQKSFLSNVNPITGHMTLVKHAGFAMTPGFVRMSQGSSMDLMMMYKKMYEVHSLDGVDITKAINTRKDGSPLHQFKNLYYYTEPTDFSKDSVSDIIKIDAIRKSERPGNYYKLAKINTSTNIKYIEEVQINNLYDLVKALGGARTLSPTAERTNYSVANTVGKYFKETAQAFEEVSIFRNLMADIPGIGMIDKIVDLDSDDSGWDGYSDDMGINIDPEELIKIVHLYNDIYPQLNGDIALEHIQNPDLFINSVLERVDNLFDLGFQSQDQLVSDVTSAFSVIAQKIDDNSLLVKDFQYHKDKVIDMISFAGAVKVGPSNLNPTDKLSNEEKQWRGAASDSAIELNGVSEEDMSSLNHSPIDANNSGSQVNTEHHIDHAELSIPTQMLNALVFGMKEPTAVNTVLEALASLVNEGINEYFDENQNDLITPEYISKVQEQVSKLMKDKYKGNESISISKIVADSFAHVPIDETKLSQDAVATLASELTRNSIKMKFDGIMAVINPTSRSVQVVEVTGGRIPVRHGNRYELQDNPGTTKLIGEDADVYIRYRTNEVKKNPNASNKILGYIEGEDPTSLAGTSKLNSPESNYGKRELAGPRLVMDITEDGVPKTIAGCLLTPDSACDLETAVAMRGVTDALNMIEGKEGFGKLPELTNRVLNIFISKANKYITKNKLEAIPLRASADKQREALLKLVEFHATVLQNHNINSFKGEDKVNRKNFILGESLKIILNQILQEDIDAMYDGNIPPNSLALNHEVWGNGRRKINKIKVLPGEIVAPPIYYKNFLLRNGDKINNINAGLFASRLNELNLISESNMPISSNSTAGIKSILHDSSGNHIYIMHNRLSDEMSLYDAIDGTPTKLMVKTLKNENGEEANFVMNSLGKRMLELPADIVIYTDESGEKFVYSKDDKLVLASTKTEEDVDYSELIDKINSSRNYGKVFAINAKPGMPITSSLERINAKIQEGNAKLAKEMETSFKHQLKITGARIPGQHFQSFQSLEVIGFIEDKDASVFVNTAVTLLSGSDFDVDKLNMIYATINKSGRYEGWHPMFDLATLEDSLNLPIPGNRSSKDVETKLTSGADPSQELVIKLQELNNAFGYLEDVTSTPTEAKKLIKETSDINDVLAMYQIINDLGIKVDPNIYSNIAKAYYYLDQHKLSLNGLKNVITNSKDKVINSPKNYIMASSPMEMYVPKFYGEEIGNKSFISKVLNKLLPTASPHQKKTNMDGKDGVGIFATALKAFSGINVAVSNALKLTGTNFNSDPAMLANIKQMLAEKICVGIEVNGVEYQLAGNVDTNLLNNLSKLSAGNSSFDTIYRLLNSNRSQLNKYFDLDSNDMSYLLGVAKLRELAKNDCAQINSQLISAATDNAKELLLSKLNATTDTSKVYAMLVSMDVPFEQIVDLLTNDALVAIIKASESDLFSEGKENISLAKVLNAVLKDEPSKYDRELLATCGITKYSDKSFKIKNTIYHTDDYKALVEYKRLSEVADEFSLLGGLFSINQGVKTDSYSLYSYEEKFNNFMVNTEQSDITFESLIKKINSFTTTEEALADPDIMRTIKDYKGNFNVPLILTLTPHFTRQMMVHITTNQVLDHTSITHKATRGLSKLFKSYGITGKGSKLTKDQFSSLETYIQDNLIHTFLNTETGSRYSTLTIPAGERLPNEEFPLESIRELNLGDPKDREVFMNWFENVVVPTIKENPSYRLNRFIGDLTMDVRNDKGYGEKVPYLRTNVNTSNPNNNNLQAVYQSYERGLKQLIGEKYGTNNLVDMFYLYNLFCYKGRGRKGSWTRILETIYKVGDKVAPEEDNLMNQYFKFLQTVENNINDSYDIPNNLEGVIEDKSKLFKYNLAGITFDMKDYFTYYGAKNNRRVNLNISSAEGGEFDESNFIPDEDQSDIAEFDYDEQDTSQEDGGYDDFDLSDDDLAGALTAAKDLPIKIENVFEGVEKGTTMMYYGYGKEAKKLPINTVEYPSKVVPISTRENQVKFSKQVPGKSDAASLTVLTEMIERFQEINPNTKIILATEKELNKMPKFAAKKQFGDNVRAALIDNVIYINSDRASEGDIIHEFSHMSLEVLRITNPTLYHNILSSVRNTPEFTALQKAYEGLEEMDYLEEVFVTKVGSLFDKTTIKNKSWYDKFTDTIDKFLNFVKQITLTLVGMESDIDAITLCGMNLEDFARKFGDDLMKKSVDTVVDDISDYDSDMLMKLSTAGIIDMNC